MTLRKSSFVCLVSCDFKNCLYLFVCFISGEVCDFYELCWRRFSRLHGNRKIVKWCQFKKAAHNCFHCKPYLTIYNLWGEAGWVTDPWPLRAKERINFSTEMNKVSKHKLKKYLFGNKMKESVMLIWTNFSTIIRGSQRGEPSNSQKINRQKRNIFTFTRQMSEPKLAVNCFF